MKIITLIEDTGIGNGLLCEHGLSFYIETDTRRIIFDTGASELTWKNAETLGIDLKSVDTVIISHGHYDHTGGLKSFREFNKSADIYIRSSAFGNFYHGSKYIGVPDGTSSLPGIKMLDYDGKFEICNGVTLFTADKKYYSPFGNSSELTENGLPDRFLHEQNLFLKIDGKRILLCGCAHSGILNILKNCEELFGGFPDIFAGGMHLIKNSLYTKAELEAITETANTLCSMPTVFYAGHCTGDAAFKILKEKLKGKLHAIYSGAEII